MQPIGVAGGHHFHRDRLGQGVPEEFGFEPGAQPGIGDLRSIAPEARFKIAADAKMIELKIDGVEMGTKIAPDIGGSDAKSGDGMTFILHGDDHGRIAPLLRLRRKHAGGNMKDTAGAGFRRALNEANVSWICAGPMNQL